MSWIFLNDAFMSIVEDGRTNKLLVRARIKGDIEKVFSDAEVSQTEENDYMFRAWIARKEVATAIARRLENIDYGNFKDSINKADKARSGVWSEMANYQDRTYGRKPYDWVSKLYAETDRGESDLYKMGKTNR